MKQKRRSLTNHKIIKISIGVVIGLLLIAQISFDVFMFRTNGDDMLITSLIIRSVEDSHKPAVIEPITGDVYLTDAKLKLPASSDSLRSIVYRYDKGPDYQNEVISISDKQMLHALESKLLSTSQSPYGGHNVNKVFDQIPSLQACSRGVQIHYKQSDDLGSGYKLEFTKTLNNDRKIYIYSEKQCDSILFPDIIEYTKLIQSY